MAPLIRLDTTDHTLLRHSATVSHRRSNSSTRHPLSSIEQTTSPQAHDDSPTSPLHRLRRAFSTRVSNSVSIPLRRLSHSRRQSEQTNDGRANEESGGQTSNTPLQFRIPPLDRFRSAGRKIIQMNRMRANTNTDPGFDARRRQSTYSVYGAVRSKCTIDVVDFGTINSRFERLDNKSLSSFLESAERPQFTHVRWINVLGLSWDVMSTLALKYKLHPLAVEDVFGGENLTRSKVDYYPQQIFLRVLCHIVRDQQSDDDEEEEGACHHQPSTTHTASPTSPHPSVGYHQLEDTGISTLVGDVGKQAGSSKTPRRALNRSDESRTIKTLAGAGLVAVQPWWAEEEDWSVPWARAVYPELKPMTPSPSWIRTKLAGMSTEARVQAQNQAIIEELKKGQRVDVDRRNMYIFFVRDGQHTTVISIHPTASRTFFAPILKSLKQRDSVLRTHAEGSFLVHALIDLVVDYASEMVEKFRQQTVLFEKQLLQNPRANIVRDVHVASADLKLINSTLKPLRSLVKTLRLRDLTKSSALAEDEEYARNNKKHFQGFMSSGTKVYLADAEDHINFIIKSLQLYADMSERLCEFSFRTLRDDTASSMRSYGLALVVFFPTIVVVQYFGMNFNRTPGNMPSVEQHSEGLLWTVAPCVLLVVIISFTWPFFESWFHFLKKRTLENRVLRQIADLQAF